MELNKEQIKYIDDLLYDSGVKFWDVRIEMLDHVVSEIEHQSYSNLDFKTTVFEVFKKMGWKENFNGSNFEEVIKDHHDSFSKKVRKRFFKTMKEDFSNPIIVTISLVLLYAFYEVAHYKELLKYFSLLILLGLVFPMIFFFTRKMFYRSIHLNHASSIAFFSLSIFNCFIYLPKMFFDFNVLNYPILVALIFGITTIQTALGIKFFFKEFEKTNDVYKKLMTL
ncbi:hypothetical protein [Tenacibaculum sp. 190524A05c]|uniref:hypothetical protein n=1 Tax=Tenacibaculum platacis TaxID=3137852 RepID=UPI0031FA8FA2